MLIWRYTAAIVSDALARVLHGLGVRRARLRPVSMVQFRPLGLLK